MVQFFCFLLSFFYVQRPGGPGFRGKGAIGGRPLSRLRRQLPWEGSLFFPLRRGDLSGAARQLPFARGAKGGVRRSQCLPLLRGGAERSEAERFRRAAAAGRPLRRCAPAPLRKGSQGACRNFLLQFLQKEKRGYPLLAVHGADDVANTTCALILAQLAVKRKKFYWNLTFFDFSWYMSHCSTFGGKMQ